MKKILALAAALFASLIFNVTAFAEEFTEADKMIFGVFPVWLFILIAAGVVMLTIIIIIETVKRKHK